MDEDSLSFSFFFGVLVLIAAFGIFVRLRHAATMQEIFILSPEIHSSTPSINDSFVESHACLSDSKRDGVAINDGHHFAFSLGRRLDVAAADNYSLVHRLAAAGLSLNRRSVSFLRRYRALACPASNDSFCFCGWTLSIVSWRYSFNRQRDSLAAV